MKIAVIDYGSGNLRSAAKMVERAAAEAGLDVDVAVTDSAATVDGASRVVLPGQGAFADCLAGIERLSGMREALERNVVRWGKPFLGICVGMQLMAERGLEHGVHGGFGWIAGEVVRLAPGDGRLKVPHMGWNELEIGPSPHPVFAGLLPGTHAYFVHSYALQSADETEVLARVDYGGPVVAAVGRDNMVGTQFHPDKSQRTGLTLIRSFLNWSP